MLAGKKEAQQCLVVGEGGSKSKVQGPLYMQVLAEVDEEQK